MVVRHGSPPPLLPVPVMPGDVLLYSGRGPWSFLIKLKTWSPISHCEMVGPGETALAARDGEGVDTFPELREDDLYAVLRPAQPIDMRRVMAFHHECRGQDYDWWGLLRFVRVGQQSTTKQFCSEYVTRLLRAGGVFPFGGSYDADLVSPGMLLASPVLDCVWIRPRKQAQA